MHIFSSNSLLMMEKSLGYLWTKQAAIMDNIANVETPNYKKKVVTFEESLRVGLESAGKTSGQDVRRRARAVLNREEPEVFEPDNVTRMDENGVNLNEQMTEMVRNAYQMQYVMSSITNELQVLASAVKGQ